MRTASGALMGLVRVLTGPGIGGAPRRLAPRPGALDDRWSGMAPRIKGPARRTDQIRGVIPRLPQLLGLCAGLLAVAVAIGASYTGPLADAEERTVAIRFHVRPGQVPGDVAVVAV